MIVCDTSVWIDYFNGRSGAAADLLDELLGNELILMPDIILLELLQGFRTERDYRTAKALLAPLPKAAALTPDRAVWYSLYFRKLRQKGITIRKTNDIVIGGFCIDNRLPLLHNDRDFDLMASVLPLHLINPT
ncbi:hypothetical protein CYPRO_3211 [Cyclonatronum proteinivorum]|uniref:Ribonuclease VapC n=1 Tax=Cyclonatronum proteinivorum TaxID=1457365 RepID=A0A345UPP2_9BACT|nr:PIN domain nuclease [Cyclonatronum proteinivorum]AXJ02444.1 hypothetical protein CYPRO_3211 [Cyclonatronum proteinivorum]